MEDQGKKTEVEIETLAEQELEEAAGGGPGGICSAWGCSNTGLD